MKLIEKDLILKEDTEFYESIKVEGNIKGFFNLKVAGNINAGDINARDINAGNINAGNIDAGNINAWDIDAGDIDAGNINAWDIDAGNIVAGDIVCETRIKKSKKVRTIARVYVKNKSKLIKKEQENE